MLELLPLLEAAKAANEEARVVIIGATGNGGKVDMDDIGLTKNFSAARAGLAWPTYTSLMVEVRQFGCETRI